MILAVHEKTGKQREFTEAAWKHSSTMSDAGWKKLDESIIAKVTVPIIPEEITARIIKKAEAVVVIATEPMIENKPKKQKTGTDDIENKA